MNAFCDRVRVADHEQVIALNAFASTLLVEFQFAHVSLSKAMEELDTLTRGPVPSADRLVAARWNISRASLTRRMLWSRALAQLSWDGAGKPVNNLRYLQEADMAMLQASSEHVRKWTVETIFSDWTAYCAASREIRWKMDAAMSTETRLLFPMLTH